jgi:large subunit ribosomal protein L29
MAKKSAAVRDLPDDVLVTQLGEAKEELFKLRFQLATGQQENTARIGQVKKDIARINTVLREREIAAHEALETSNG